MGVTLIMKKKCKYSRTRKIQESIGRKLVNELTPKKTTKFLLKQLSQLKKLMIAIQIKISARLCLNPKALGILSNNLQSTR